MSHYRYKLNNYHAIECADIAVNGITVLSGENGCGKSTLSRWLYYLVNEASLYDKYLFDDYVRKVTSLVGRIDFAASGFRSPLAESNPTESSRISYRTYARRMRQVDYQSEDSIHEVQELFFQALHRFSESLLAYLEVAESDANRRRVLRYLDMKLPQNRDYSQATENFVVEYQQIVDHLTMELVHSMENRPLGKFMEMIPTIFKETDTAPDDIQLAEDEVNLLNEGHIGTLFNLQRAIYIDTPMAITTDVTRNIFWTELRDMILKPSDAYQVDKLLLRRIKNLLGGEAALVEVDEGFDEKELRFVSADHLINIELGKVATGFKTFSYLQRLLENGYITSETLLLIDEPEAHLHPQWIVEYARLLVLLYKKVGVKIMLASHNPDMVAAIRAIAEKENVLDVTRFYIAKEGTVPHKYVYHDLGTQITEIFSSFNIALDRIESYGASSLS